MPKSFTLQTTCDGELKSKLIELNQSFKKKYDGQFPDFFVKVPGRVNLIGEHIDYSGYNVCPMAIKQSIFGAVKVVDDLNVSLSNVNYQTYGDYSCKIDQLVIDNQSNSAPYWYQYVLCGFKGVLEIAGHIALKGLIIHFDGTIPPAAGLSSSSALVCAAALSLCLVLGIDITKRELAELSAKAEQHIGTEGGGMDQAIIFNAKCGSASQISFEPLRLSEVQIPPTGTFVIAQSMVAKNKAASNDFNSRVVECRLSSLIIARKYGLRNWQTYTKLADVQKELKFDLGKMLKIVRDTFHDDYYTKEEVCQILDMSEEELEDRFLTKNTKQLNKFKLKNRALHVFGEALRVDMFCKICESTKSLPELGRLMFESHSSLKELYECSHVELDKLVAMCSINGALGARLTGAGWGGCVVALVPFNGADEFVKLVKASFYAGQVSASASIDNLIFMTKPYDGATAFDYSVLEKA